MVLKSLKKLFSRRRKPVLASLKLPTPKTHRDMIRENERQLHDDLIALNLERKQMDARLAMAQQEQELREIEGRIQELQEMNDEDEDDFEDEEPQGSATDQLAAQLIKNLMSGTTAPRVVTPPSPHPNPPSGQPLNSRDAIKQLIQ